MFHLDDCTALITGASSGLGSEFARQLAGRARKLILVARRSGHLLALKGELEGGHTGLEVITYSADLTRQVERESFLAWLEAESISPDLLINNAGMGDYGDFGESDWAKVDAMLQLNMVALTHLAHALLPGMRSVGGAAIVNVSSLASLLPIPDFAVYAASKAYVTSFSEALRHELRADQVNVVAVCPGGEVGRDSGRQRGAVKLESSTRLVGSLSTWRRRWWWRRRFRLRCGTRLACSRAVPVFLTASVIGALPAPLLRCILARRGRYDSGRG